MFDIGVRRIRKAKTTGWRPTCECNAEPVPAIVLDPFAGTGTTLAVAQKLGRHAIGIDAQPRYLNFIKERLARPQMQSADQLSDLEAA